MIKKLVLLFIAIFAIQSYGQEGTASPYSFYGIGSLQFKGSVENRSMGGLGIYKDSIHINFKNPATYGDNELTSFNNESRPIKFTVGGGHSSTNIESNTRAERANSTTFDYLALSVPVGKFGFGFGLLPFSSVGYEFETRNEANDIDFRYDGEGGVNKAFLAVGYQLSRSLSIGLQVDYNFGNIKNNTLNVLFNEEGEPLEFFTRQNNRSDLNGANFILGLHYKNMVSSKLELQSSFTFTPQAELRSKNQRTLSTITLDTFGSDIVSNSIDVDLSASDLRVTDLTLPSQYTIGAGFGEPRKWFAGFEFSSTQTSNFSNPLIDNAGTTFEDASKISLGGFYIPEYNSFSKYWKAVVYRAGLRFEETGLNINNQSIDEFGISFGVGLPIGRLFENANIGFEFGQRGTTNANLVEENFVNFQISLSLNDRWFVKRKYD